MTRPTLCLLLIAGLLSSAAWAADTTPAPSAGSWAPGQGTEGAKAPTASTAAPAEVSAAPTAASASAPAMATEPTPTASAAPAASTQAPAANTPVQAAAPAPATPAMASAPVAMSTYSGGSLPQRGMNMDNVEHIFGTPLQKQDAVGKPPISRWVYADYVVYFEYNMVLHTVMKSDAFTRTPGR